VNTRIVYARVGFAAEGIGRKAVRLKGRYRDVLRMAVVR
jgi:RimJ/RimL family protein N-acetyltransferase